MPTPKTPRPTIDEPRSDTTPGSRPERLRVMDMLVTGIGDAFTRRWFGSSAVIHAPRGFVLIDCPDPIHRVLAEASRHAGWPIDAGAIDDIILTHLHGDHCNGLESFGFLRRRDRVLSGKGVVPRLHTSAVAAERLWSKLAPAMEAPFGADRPSRLDDFFDVRVFPEPGSEEPADVAGLRVRTRWTGHSVPTTALMIEAADVSLGWSSDTPFDRDLIDWLAPADLIVHESNRGHVHTPIDDLNALPATLRDRMRLVHLPDDFDPTSSPIRGLEQGEVVRIAAASAPGNI